MFTLESKTRQRLAPAMQRVLIVDPEPEAARSLSDLLRQIGPCQVWTAPDGGLGADLAARIDPHILFIDHAANGPAFVRGLRRSRLACRKAPVIMLTVEITARFIIEARDAGANELLRRPCTIEALWRRVEAVLLRERDWIEAVTYAGPDRRQFNVGDVGVLVKRRRDGTLSPRMARIWQAMNILHASAHYVQSNPDQALRSMLAQTDALKAAGGLGSRLNASAVDLETWLTESDLCRVPPLEVHRRIAALSALVLREDIAAAA